MNDKLIRNGLQIILPMILIMICIGCRPTAPAIDALPFQQDAEGHWGLIATDGQIKVACGTFSKQPSAVINGMFSLPDEEGYYQLYHIDRPTQPVCMQRFARIGHFFEDVTLAQEFPDSPILIIDRNGKTINDIGVSLHYDIVLAHNFSEGRALFCTRKGKFGFMDTEGTITIPPVYDQAFDFHEDRALVGKANEAGEMSYQLIDRMGNIQAGIQAVSSLLDQRFCNGLLLYSHRTNGKFGYLNLQGESILYLPDSIQEASRFYHDAAIIRNGNGSTGLIDRKGKLLIAPEYEDGWVAGENRVCLKKGSQWILADFEGKVINTPTIDERITTFYPSERAIAQQDNSYFWIDKEGKPMDGNRYAQIVEDASAMQLAPQVFVRQSKNNNTTEAGKETENTHYLKTDKPSEPEEASRPKTPKKEDTKKKDDYILNTQEWKNITQNSPFYNEAKKVLTGKLPETDADNRRMILNYVEHLRTSYTTKDIEFLEQLFSEEALIIVGKVIRNAPKMEGQYLSQEQVQYNVKSKRAYLDRLKLLFKTNKEIKLKFSDFKIMRHPTLEGIYGVTLRQGYSSDLYSDDGYLFLLWDFRDEASPLIHVRTWQPSMLNDQTPLPEKDIFNIRNFNLQ